MVTGDHIKADPMKFLAARYDEILNEDVIIINGDR
jgi:hypothetical protein